MTGFAKFYYAFGMDELGEGRTDRRPQLYLTLSDRLHTLYHFYFVGRCLLAFWVSLPFDPAQKIRLGTER